MGVEVKPEPEDNELCSCLDKEGLKARKVYGL